MANKTIAVHLPQDSGNTSLTIRLRAGGTIINTPDTLTETSSTGYFTATVDDVVSAGWHSVDILSGATVRYAGGWVYLPGDTAGTYIVDEPQLMRGTDNALLASGYTAPANSDITAIKAKTDNLPASPASSTDVQLLAVPVISPTLERVNGDTDAIRFTWPVDSATITGEVSKNGGSYAAVVGAITQRTTEAGIYWYQLAHNAADRTLGSVRYKFTDGTRTRFVNLLVNPATASVDLQPVLDKLPESGRATTLTASDVWSHATRSLTTFGTLVSDIWSHATRTLTAISDSSGITTLLSRIAGNIRTSADDVTAETAQTAAVRSGLALEATVDAAETSILAAIDGIEGGGSGLTGDYTLTVTVTDAADDEPIEAATVTLFRTGERGALPTDDGGEAVFGVDAATWSYVVRAAGYQSATGTKVIAADDTLAVELTAIVVNQAAAPACNVVLPVIDQYLAPAAEVLVCIEFLSFLPNATKTAVIVNHPPSLLSDANGQVEVTLARLAKYRATYQVRNESPKRVEFSTPNAGSFTVVEA